MKLNTRLARSRTIGERIDISKYTEMEIEASHDTANVTGITAGVHLNPETINSFVHQNDKINTDLKSQALNQ